MGKLNFGFPNLRFPGFEGEWEAKKLSDVANKIGDGLHGTPDYTDNSDYYFINGNNLVDGKIEIYENTKKVSTSTFFKNNKDLKENTLLISINGTIGSIAKYNNEKVMLGKSVGYFNFNNNSDFIYFTLHTKSIQDYFFSELTGSTIKNLSLKTLRDTIIYLPSSEEQSKISYFLSLIEKRIQTQRKIIEKLETLMKGSCEKLFLQKLSFSTLKEPWKILKLEDIFDFHKGSPFSKNDILESGILKCIHYGELFTIYNAVISKVVSRTNTEGFKSKTGDLLMPSSDVTPLGLATASVVLEDNIVLGGDINILRSKVNINSIFISYLLNFEKKKIIELVSGTTVKHIYNKDLKQIKVCIPTIEEQNKIANFLSSIQEKIDTEKQILEKLELQKMFLLSNLFV